MKLLPAASAAWSLPMATVPALRVPAWPRCLLPLLLFGHAAPVPAQAQPATPPPEAVSLFSQAAPGTALPAGWQRRAINDKKRPTDYALVADGSTVVLHATARGAASMALRPAPADLPQAPIVRWRWRVGQQPPGADNAVAAREDAAARLVFVFDGDASRLPWADRMKMKLARSLSGQDMPYATLMYVASSTAPLGAWVPNPHTGRIQMVVAQRLVASGGWHTMERNLHADYRTAFGEAPGRLLAYGVMTDSDNTGATAEAWYGDIRLVPRR